MESKLTEYISGVKSSPADDWTYRKADTQYMTHGFHPYPARMIPQVARRLIQTYIKSQDQLILDPFMGSGGVLVESILNGNNAIGVDLNPLAILISKVKTTPIDPDLLAKFSTQLTKGLPERKTHKQYAIPKINGLHFWFKDSAIEDLATIRSALEELDTPIEVTDFLRVCFSVTVRKSSNIKNGEYKLYRRQGKEHERFKPHVFETFAQTIRGNIDGMRSFWAAVKKLHRIQRALPMLWDSRRLSELRTQVEAVQLRDKGGNGRASLVVSSPPYGDARTTVAYGQFSRYSALWLGLPPDQVYSVDDAGLGGAPISITRELKSPILDKTLAAIEERDKARALQVYAFFDDLDRCMEQISKVLIREKSHCCFVTGNRTVKRLRIPTDQILVEMATKYGFRHLTTHYREIPTKTIPWVNAPENIPGMSGETMNKESIVIWNF
jgi:site-specific DNA-methyltransferase (cytosine-N4-specific)